MMFPWVCLSSKHNYSKIISECFSSATKYMSVPEERAKTMRRTQLFDLNSIEALKIAIEAKIKKQAILAKDIANASLARTKKTEKKEEKEKGHRRNNSTTTIKSIQVTDATFLEKTPAKKTNFLSPKSTIARHDIVSPSNRNSSKLLSPKISNAQDVGFFITSAINDSISLSKIDNYP